MKNRKEFDCVQMKWDIQKRLLDEFQAMTTEEMRRAQHERIAADPLLGPFLQKVAVPPPTVVQSRD